MNQPSLSKGHDKKRKADHSINNVERSCDTPGVTVAATMFYSTSAVQSTVHLGLSSLSKLNLSFEYY
jgi:hypothetical protein